MAGRAGSRPESDHELDRDRIAEIERRQLERALGRLEGAGELSDDQREVVGELASSIATALGPAAVTVTRAGRRSPPDRSRLPGVEGRT